MPLVSGNKNYKILQLFCNISSLLSGQTACVCPLGAHGALTLSVYPQAGSGGWSRSGVQTLPNKATSPGEGTQLHATPPVAHPSPKGTPGKTGSFWLAKMGKVSQLRFIAILT